MVEQAVFFFIMVLLIALALEPIADKLKLPFSSALLLVGFLCSEILVYHGIDTGIRWHNFDKIVFYYLIPILIFESAFNMNAGLFVKNLVPTLFLAIPIVLVSTLSTAAFLYVAMDDPVGFPWLAALIAGALLTATDPVAVVALFKKAGVSERLLTLLDGESLLNDATVIVMVTLLISASLESDLQIEFSGVLVEFCKIFFGGLVVGVLIGAVGLIIIPRVTQSHICAVLSLISAYLSFYCAEHLLHVSGIMSVLMCGLLLAHATRKNQHQHQFMHQLWGFKSYIANALLFFISGVTFQLTMFVDQWQAISYGIVAIMISRAVGVYLLLPTVNIIPKVPPVSLPYRSVLFWGGIRGPVTLALALSLPTELPYWWTIQSIAYGVVFFTLFVNAPTMSILLQRYRVQVAK